MSKHWRQTPYNDVDMQKWLGGKWCLQSVFNYLKIPSAENCPNAKWLMLVKKSCNKGKVGIHIFAAVWLPWWCRCCNTCDDVKEAYRQRGWALQKPEQIAQCHRDGFVSQLAEQKNEGCRVYGYLEVNRVSGSSLLLIPSTLNIKMILIGSIVAVQWR